MRGVIKQTLGVRIKSHFLKSAVDLLTVLTEQKSSSGSSEFREIGEVNPLL